MSLPHSNRKRHDVVIMLLGSGKHLRHRKKARDQLAILGFKKVIIMEEHKELIDNKTEYGGIDEKFEWLVARYHIDRFFAFFHNDTFMDAVIFEIGWICGKFGTRNIGNKLMFLFQPGYDFEKQRMPSYINALFYKVPRVEFNEAKSYTKSSEIIRTALVSNLPTRFIIQ